MSNLSLIVPVFNPGDALERLLGSLKAVNTEVELIFIDDGCTDGSRTKLELFLEGRSGTLLSGENLGPGAARNLGIEASNSEFIAFADADDECRIDVLMESVNLAIESNADVVIAGYELISGEFSRKAVTPVPIPLDQAERSSFRCVEERSAVWGKIYRRDHLVRNQIYFPKSRGAEDVVFSYRLAISAPLTITVNSLAYSYYLNNNGQLTSSREYFNQGAIALHDLLQECPLKQPERTLLAQVILSSVPHLVRGMGAASGITQSTRLLFEMTRGLGVRPLLEASVNLARSRIARRKVV